ncbi:MAG: NAD(P)H-dependent oxidoreductase [Pseudolysinimonas sp.]|uniref:NADPH-dependent FMN reductase n=1 Tax=Pseudolysinimonas sp. TaxID=2680009 RepID=UPI003264BA40
MSRIAVLVASTRSTRFADNPLAWLQTKLNESAFEFDVIDVRDLDLPYYDLPTPPAWAHREYATEAERRLGERLDAADGFLVITHEFNHGYSAPLKNVLDHYFIELAHKPIGFIGYGNAGGSRAIEQLKQVVIELDMVPIRHSVNVMGPQYFAIRDGVPVDEAFEPLGASLDKVLKSLTWWVDATAAARAGEAKLA